MTLANTINTAIDTAQSIAGNPMLRLIGLVFPQATSVIDIIERYKGTIDKAQPIIAAAVEAGEPVFNKVVEQLPKFATVVSSVLHASPSIHGLTPGVMAENVARVLGGFGRMTPEQEMKWMNDMTPGNDPSQENSKFTVG